MFESRLIPRALVVFLLLLAPVLAEDGAPVRLAWKFEKGKVRTEISENLLTSKAKMNGQIMETKSHVTMWMVIEVLDTKEGVATLKKIIKRVVVKMKAPGMGTIDWDSDSDETPEGPARSMIQRYKQVIGTVNTVRMKPTGEILDVKGEAIDGSKAKEQAPAPVFPEALSVGSKIESENVTMQGPVKVTAKATYTYKGRFDGIDSFNIGASQSFDVPPESPSQVKIVKQSAEGYFLFDASKGWQIGSESRTEMQIEATTPQGSFSPRIETLRRVLVIEGENTKALLKSPQDVAPAKKGD